MLHHVNIKKFEKKIIILAKDNEKKLSKEELIELVRKIRNVEYDSEKAHSEAILLFENNVPDPSGANLIYHHKPRLTDEEVVEKALAYKPMLLGQPDDKGE